MIHHTRLGHRCISPWRQRAWAIILIPGKTEGELRRTAVAAPEMPPTKGHADRSVKANQDMNNRRSPQPASASAAPNLTDYLSLRVHPLPKGALKKPRQRFADEIYDILTETSRTGEASSREYRQLAANFARLIARQPAGFGDNGKMTAAMAKTLAQLREHLRQETKIALENKFARPGVNLCKYSLNRILEVLQRLQNHEHEVVRASARTILATGLNYSDLAVAEKLADDVHQLHQWLTRHRSSIVRNNAGTILNTVIHYKADFAAGAALAQGAQKVYDRLRRHPRGIVRRNANTIMHAAFRLGSVAHAQRLAQGVWRQYVKLKRHRSPIVRRNARVIIHAALHNGAISHAERIAQGTQRLYARLKADHHANIRRYAKSVLSDTLTYGTTNAVPRRIRSKYAALTRTSRY